MKAWHFLQACAQIIVALLHCFYVNCYFCKYDRHSRDICRLTWQGISEPALLRSGARTEFEENQSSEFGYFQFHLCRNHEDKYCFIGILEDDATK